jgi:hypothetical protein
MWRYYLDLYYAGMIPSGGWIPSSAEEMAKSGISVKLVRRSGFWIRWNSTPEARTVEIEERRFYEEAKREEWTPKHPRLLTFKRIGDTNEFMEA